MHREADGGSLSVVPGAFSLAGRVALVTGAGSAEGIGFATARLLSELGAAVALSATTGRAHERAAELAARGVPAVGWSPTSPTSSRYAAPWPM